MEILVQVNQFQHDHSSEHVICGEFATHSNHLGLSRDTTFWIIFVGSIFTIRGHDLTMNSGWNVSQIFEVIGYVWPLNISIKNRVMNKCDAREKCLNSKDHLYRMVIVEVQQYLTKPNHCIWPIRTHYTFVSTNEQFASNEDDLAMVQRPSTITILYIWSLVTCHRVTLISNKNRIQIVWRQFEVSRVFYVFHISLHLQCK